jgi:hypothetical protein
VTNYSTVNCSGGKYEVTWFLLASEHEAFQDRSFTKTYRRWGQYKYSVQYFLRDFPLALSELPSGGSLQETWPQKTR